MSRIERPETLTEAVANHIKNAIIGGEYEPGVALPEVRLATEFGTSRGTVREALRTLADEGLVDVFAHRGSFVSTITPKKVAEVYAVRLVLEPLAVGLSMESGALADDNLRSEAKAKLEEMRETASANNLIAMIAAERELHRLLWWPCDNELLRGFLSDLLTQTRRMLLYTRPYERDLGREFEEHKALVETVLNGDQARAVEAVRQHLADSRDVVLEKMREPRAAESTGNSLKTPVERAEPLAPEVG